MNPHYVYLETLANQIKNKITSSVKSNDAILGMLNQTPFIHDEALKSMITTNRIGDNGQSELGTGSKTHAPGLDRHLKSLHIRSAIPHKILDGRKRTAGWGVSHLWLGTNTKVYHNCVLLDTEEVCQPCGGPELGPFTLHATNIPKGWTEGHSNRFTSPPASVSLSVSCITEK